MYSSTTLNDLYAVLPSHCDFELPIYVIFVSLMINSSINPYLYFVLFMINLAFIFNIEAMHYINYYFRNSKDN
jgi:hypothetical protein